MPRVKWNISAGAVLPLALAYFFDESGLVSAAIPAVLIHELSHAVVLLVCGAKLSSISLEVFGLEMDYSGLLSRASVFSAAMAGPAAGLAYALLAVNSGYAYLRLSGAISFMLSLFNLLPILPLDGGRMIEVFCGFPLARTVSRVCALLFFFAGCLLICRWGIMLPAIMAIWLFVLNVK